MIHRFDWKIFFRTTPWMGTATFAVLGSVGGVMPFLQWIMAFLLLICSALITLATYAKLPSSWGMPTSTERYRTVTPLIIAACCGLIALTIWTQWPLRLAFADSRDKLEEIALSSTDSAIPQHGGWFTVGSVIRKNGITTLMSADGPERLLLKGNSRQVYAEHTDYQIIALDDDWYWAVSM